MHTRSMLLLMLLSLMALGISPLAAQQRNRGPVPLEPAGVMSPAERWVDSLMRRMTLEEKVGQLIMIPVYSDRGGYHQHSVRRFIKDYKIGGLIFMQGDAEKQLTLANLYRSLSTIPLLTAQDAEWGLSMRLRGTMAYPKNLTLGAIRDDSLLYALGARMAKELKRTGVHLNFAPVMDVNDPAQGPIVNVRSFGENPFNVARKGIMLSLGLQDHGVMACAKHFPGQGDAGQPAGEFGLPVVHSSLEFLDTLAMFPFVKSMEQGIGAVMVGNFSVPALDPTPGLSASLSSLVITDLLREKLGYGGLIFTDALSNGSIAEQYLPGEAEVLAFKAGNDMLLFPNDIPVAINSLVFAVKQGDIRRRELDDRVRRILIAKYELGLTRLRPMPLAHLQDDLQNLEARILKRKLYRASLTLVKNHGQLLPLQNLENRRIAYVQISGPRGNKFERSLQKYAGVRTFFLSKNFSQTEKKKLLDELRSYNTVIIGVFGMNQWASKQFGLSQTTIELSRQIARGPWESVLTLFGSPYALKNFGSEKAILVAYEQVDEAMESAAAGIFGGQRIDGRLPVTASKRFREGQGLVVEAPIRFGFAYPEEVGMNSRVLSEIDEIATKYIREGAMPGCAILVMRGGRIVYEKGFGRTEYKGKGIPIDPLYHTYDIASVTKVSVTTPLTMRMVELGKLDLDMPISFYLPEFRGTDKANLTPRRLLQHNAGLPAWIPFYKETLTERGQLNRQYYSHYPSRQYPVPIARDLYSTSSLQDLVWAEIISTPVIKTDKVRYSDLGLIIMGKLLERINHDQGLEQLAARHFYQPLGMGRTFYKPTDKGMQAYCPPTENDREWRKGVVQGYVHDPAAAILGGVAGHAGLFANVYDLAKLMRMMENGGVYGGQRYLRTSTVDYFTRRQLVHSRKGLGWDKPEPDRARHNPASDYASAETFGHTGFTGTCVWADPREDIVYIFLSNRTYPRASNRMLYKEEVRSKIMDKIYLSIRQFHVLAYQPTQVNP